MVSGSVSGLTDSRDKAKETEWPVILKLLSFPDTVFDKGNQSIIRTRLSIVLLKKENWIITHSILITSFNLFTDAAFNFLPLVKILGRYSRHSGFITYL